MAAEHWFNALNKVLVRPTPRRTILHTTATVAGLLGTRLPETPGNAATKRCARKECREAFPGEDQQDDRRFCEIKCGRCRKRSKFCIVDDDQDGTLIKKATCCRTGQDCCSSGPATLCLATKDATCCPDDPGLGFCLKGSSYKTCCPGVGCVNSLTDPDHCGGCNFLCAVDEECVDGACVCPDGQERCDGRCVDTDTDPDHCGRCNFLCAANERCVDGGCVGCTWYCCHANDSGTCVGPQECCTERCAGCVGGGTCLRWRDGRVGGFCEERPWQCGQVREPCVVDGVWIACCAEGYTCTPSGCRQG